MPEYLFREYCEKWIVRYDGDNGKIYVDIYKKWLNVAENHAV